MVLELMKLRDIRRAMADFETLKLLPAPEIKDSESQTNLLLGLMPIIGGPEGSPIAAASRRPSIRRQGLRPEVRLPEF